MEKYRSLNTALLTLYLITLLFYWSILIPGLQENSTLYAFSSLVLTIMNVVYYIQIFNNSKLEKADKRLIILFSILLLGHSFFSCTTFLQAINIYFLFTLYIALSYVKITRRKIYKSILYLYVGMTLVLIPFLLKSFFDGTDGGFAGIFSSSNSIGTLGVSVVLAFFLLDNKRNKKRTSSILLILYLIIVIYSSYQRSAILMLLVWVGLYFLLKKGWKRSIIFFSFLTALTLVGTYMVVDEIINDNKTSDVQLMGKEASSRGRSLQIFTAFNNFDVSVWGAGRGEVGELVEEEVGYVVHNTFVTSLLEYGVLIFLFYLFFLYGLFMKKQDLSASFILAFHVILFFEPSHFFSNQLLSFIPFLMVLLDDNKPQFQKISLQTRNEMSS